MQLESIEGIVESVSKLACTLHGIVSQQVESKIASRKRALLRIMDRYIHFNVEFVQI